VFRTDRREGAGPVLPLAFALIIPIALIPYLALNAFASTEPLPSTEQDVRLSVLSLPVKGLLLLLVIALPALLGSRREPERVVPHVLLFYGALVLVGLAGAVLAVVAIHDHRPSYLTLVPAAIAVLALYTVVLIRYLDHGLTHAAIAGLAFSMVSLVCWMYVVYGNSHVWSSVEDMLAGTYPAWLLLLAAVVGVETYKLHYKPVHVTGSERDPGGVDEGRRHIPRGLLVELFVLDAFLAAVLLVIIA
jgi:hypothetical protein